jgi:hypothetical protein
MLGDWPSCRRFSKVRDHNDLLVLESTSVRKYILVLFIKKFEVTVDKDVFMSLSQAQDRCPILEDTVFHPDLGLGIDFRVAFVLLLPWLGCGESSIFRVTPLDCC